MLISPPCFNNKYLLVHLSHCTSLSRYTHHHYHYHSNSSWDTTDGELSVSTDHLQAGLFVPVSEIKAARRRAVQGLLEATRLHEKDKGVRRVLNRVLCRAVLCCVALCCAFCHGCTRYLQVLCVCLSVMCAYVRLSSVYLCVLW